MKCTVYGLQRKDEAQVRYVGQTTRPLHRRLHHHLCTARKDKAARHCLQWLRKAMRDGVEVEIIPLVREAEWNVTEVEVIRRYREAGVDLVNAADGGKGSTGYRMPDRFRQKCRARMRGNRLRRGKKVSAEGRRNISEGHKKFFAENGHHSTGTTLSRAVKAKISAALKGRKFSEETLKKMRKPKSPAHCIAQSLAASRRWARERERRANG